MKEAGATQALYVAGRDRGRGLNIGPHYTLDGMGDMTGRTRGRRWRQWAARGRHGHDVCLGRRTVCSGWFGCGVLRPGGGRVDGGGAYEHLPACGRVCAPWAACFVWQGGRHGKPFRSVLPEQSVLSTVERYDPVADEWTTLAQMGSNRDLVGVCALGGMLYAVQLLGNNSLVDGKACKPGNVERYDPAADA